MSFVKTRLGQCYKRRNGRNKQGLLIFRTRGGQKKNLYRYIDFFLDCALFLSYLIIDFLYDSYRNSFLMSVIYMNGIFSYRLGIEKVRIGMLYDFVLKDIKLFGTVLLLKNIFEGKFICNVPFIKGKRVALALSAGAAVLLVKLDLKYKLAVLKLKRNVFLILSNEILCVYGKVCNFFNQDLIKGKAGFRRNKGYRPIVRGIARNPVDHPNGGRTPGGKVYRSFSFRIARCKKKTTTKFQRNYYLKNLFILSNARN